MLELPGDDSPEGYKKIPVADVLNKEKPDEIKRHGWLVGRITLLRGQAAGFHLMADSSACPIRKATLMEVSKHCEQDADQTEEELFKLLGTCPRCGKAH